MVYKVQKEFRKKIVRILYRNLFLFFKLILDVVDIELINNNILYMVVY